MRFLTPLALLAVLVSSPPPVASQQPDAPEALRLFLDCQAPFCDFDYFRREIAFVNWVRDRQDAELHVLVTAQRTGSGGWEFTLTYLGGARFAGWTDTLLHLARSTDTQDEIRGGLTRILKLGLVRYVARSPLGERLIISYQPSAGGAPAQRPRDPWNYWVFTARIGGDLNGEEQQKSLAVNGSLSANRTTEMLKLSLSASGRYSRSQFRLTDTSTFTNTQKNFTIQAQMVYSLGDHWSVGIRPTAISSTFLNQDLAVQAGPAIEYDIFPYSQSSRRQFTLTYMAGIATFDYQEETIFDRFSDVLPAHNLQVALRFQQPWGSVNTSVQGQQYLHQGNGTKHRIDLFTGLNLRIVRGLSLNLFGSFARVKDQLYLPKGTLSAEEILVRRRQLGTDYRYFGNVGLSYTFGSAFSNVVNPRMGGSAGGIVIFN